MEQKPQITAEQLRGKPFQKGDDPRRNLAGRPVGSLDFKTKFYRVIDKLAKQNDISPEEVEEQLMLVGYKKAKDGDYSFYRDLMDRIHGKAPQVINLDADVTTNNDGLTKEEREALLNLLK